MDKKEKVNYKKEEKQQIDKYMTKNIDEKKKSGHKVVVKIKLYICNNKDRQLTFNINSQLLPILIMSPQNSTDF